MRYHGAMKPKAAVIAAALGTGLAGAVVVARTSQSCEPSNAAASDASLGAAETAADVAAVVDAYLDTPPRDASAPAGCDFIGPHSRTGASRRVRIVGGGVALEGAFPFAVGLATASRFHFCGGALLSPRHVLTAAHCQVAVGNVALYGSNDLRKARAAPVVESRIHPRFDDGTLDYDLAIAVLGEDVPLPSVELVDSLASPLSATAIGWGATSEGGLASPVLRQVDLPMTPWDDCRSTYSSLTTRQLCAGRPAGGADSCQGDSGGALLTRGKTAWQILGLVSYGEGCARPGVPGVYTDLRAPEIRTWVAACAR